MTSEIVQTSEICGFVYKLCFEHNDRL